MSIEWDKLDPPYDGVGVVVVAAVVLPSDTTPSVEVWPLDALFGLADNTICSLVKDAILYKKTQKDGIM